MGMRLSEHFTLAEATTTKTGIPNIPAPEELRVLSLTAAKMEKVRKVLGNKPIIVTSWFRSEKINQAVGGVPNSQHRLGEAVDFVCPAYGTVAQIIQTLRTSAVLLMYDQLIKEPSWVHISFLTNPADPRTTPRLQYLDLSK